MSTFDNSRKDRITIQEKEREAQRQKQLEQEAKRAAEERKKQTIKVCIAHL